MIVFSTKQVYESKEKLSQIPTYIWTGGCDTDGKIITNKIIENTYDVKSCNIECLKYTWCTSFSINIDLK